jgi:hypothetical protein
VVFDMCEAEAEDARALIEQWRLVHRGSGPMPAEQAPSQDETRREPMDGPPSPAVDFAAGSKDVGLSDYVKMPLEQRVVIKSS